MKIVYQAEREHDGSFQFVVLMSGECLCSAPRNPLHVFLTVVSCACFACVFNRRVPRLLRQLDVHCHGQVHLVQPVHFKQLLAPRRRRQRCVGLSECGGQLRLYPYTQYSPLPHHLDDLANMAQAISEMSTGLKRVRDQQHYHRTRERICRGSKPPCTHFLLPSFHQHLPSSHSPSSANESTNTRVLWWNVLETVVC